MNYFIDLEFLEGPQRYRKSFWEALLATKKYTESTIDLISIGIVCEDGREYYAISKDFNLREAWNRYDLKKSDYHPNGMEPSPIIKEYWIRENVLKPIFNELVQKWALEEDKANQISCTTGYNPPIKFNYASLKKLIDKYGKTNKQIAEDIKSFTKCIQPLDIKFKEVRENYRVFEYTFLGDNKPTEWFINKNVPECDINNTIINYYNHCKPEDIKFYGYYSDYDWVVFCWLFGKMIDLPKGFPMYCVDLKQTLDEKAKAIYNTPTSYCSYNSPQDKLVKHVRYPKQTNEHNALSDARWNFELYKFLNELY